MIFPKKTYNYISNKFVKKYYDNSNTLKKKEKFTWERNTRTPIFLVNKVFWIHKGVHFRKKVLEYYHLSTTFGSFTLTRKPFSPPFRKNGFNKKKRNG